MTFLKDVAPPTFLVVDDKYDFTSGLVEYVTNTIPGVITRQANSEQEALSVIHENGPHDVVVVDLSLTGSYGTQGINICREARRKSRFSEIILITRFATGDRIASALSQGANQYLDRLTPKFDEILRAVIEDRLQSAVLHRIAFETSPNFSAFEASEKLTLYNIRLIVQALQETVHQLRALNVTDSAESLTVFADQVQQQIQFLTELEKQI